MKFCNIKVSENKEELIVTQTLFTFYKVTALLYCSIQKMKEDNPDADVWVTMNYESVVDDSFVFGRLRIREDNTDDLSSLVITPTKNGFSLTVPVEVFENAWVNMARQHADMIGQGNIAAIIKLTINLIHGSLAFSIQKLNP